MKTQTLKSWYISEFPSDREEAENLNPSATFEDLFRTLDNYGNVYECMGYVDSLIRERLFERLAEIMEVSYNEIYEQWLKATQP
jgi:hypothetical protein